MSIIRFRQRTKRIARILRRKDRFWDIQKKHTTTRLGSQYAGWDIVTEFISPSSTIYSFGVGDDVSFDLALIDQFKVAIHAFDPTPRSIAWVKEQNLPEAFILHEYGLADFDGDLSLNPPNNPNHVSYTLLEKPSTRHNAITAPVKKLETIMRDLGHNNLDILKMDIEGAEYQIVTDLIKSPIRPIQILIEFHHRFPEVSLNKTETAVAQLNEIGYHLFSVSDTGEEFGFFYEPSPA